MHVKDSGNHPAKHPEQSVMYAVELCFAIDAGSVAPSPETMEASFRRNGLPGAARIEYLRVKRVDREIYVVAFVAAGDATRAGEWAVTTGWAVAGELHHLSFIGFRIWTDDQFATKGGRT
jgi:hypothetical protein